MRAYVSTIRHQPALGWKIASLSCFASSYLLDHSVAQLLVLLGITWGLGFPLGYVLWRLGGRRPG